MGEATNEQTLQVPQDFESLELIHVTIRNKVVIVNYNNPYSKVNCYSTNFNHEVFKVFTFIQDNLKIIRGTVILSSKPDNFFAGVDIKELNQWSPEFAYYISQSEYQATIGGHKFVLTVFPQRDKKYSGHLTAFPNHQWR